MSRTKKFLINSISTAILQCITMIMGFLIPRVMLKVYGSEINGLVSSISQFIAYFNLVEAGLSGAAIYSLYKPLAQNDYMKINGVISAAKKFYTQSGYIFISLTLGLALIYPLYIKTNLLSPINVGVLVLILGVNGALEFFTLSKYRVLLSADQKTYVISIASTFQIIINTLLIVILANLNVSIVILRGIALFSVFLRSFILMIYCKKKYSYINYKETPHYESLNQKWDVLYLQVLGAIQAGTPIVIITLLLKDLKTVSIYSIFNMVTGGIMGLLGIFVSGLSASFGDVIARGQIKTLQKSYNEFEFSYYSLITIIYSVAFTTIISFVNIYTKGINDTNYNLPVVGFLFVLNGLLYNLKTPQGMIIISAGLYKETKWQTTVQGAITVVVGIILTPFLGLIGVLIGAILSNIYRDIDLLFYVPKMVIKTSVKQTIFRIIRMLISVCIICFPFIFVKFVPNNLYSWAVYVLVVGFFAVLIVIAMGVIFERELIKSILKRFKDMVGVKNG